MCLNLTPGQKISERMSKPGRNTSAEAYLIVQGIQADVHDWLLCGHSSKERKNGQIV